MKGSVQILLLSASVFFFWGCSSKKPKLSKNRRNIQSLFALPAQHNQLQIRFVKSFQKIYDNRHDKHKDELSLWRVDSNAKELYVNVITKNSRDRVKREGYFPLGHVAYSSRDKIPLSVVVVKGVEGITVARPIGFEKIWTDKHSDRGQELSMWRPIPKENFVCLGDLASIGRDKKPLDQIWCVHKDFVSLGKAKYLWSNRRSFFRRSFSKKERASIWESLAKDDEFGPVRPNVFRSTSNFNQPKEQYILNYEKVRDVPFERRDDFSTTDWTALSRKLAPGVLETLCEVDHYKSSTGVSPFMEKVIADLKGKKKIDWIVHPDENIVSGHVDNKVLRGGNEIFGKMQELIENAEHEVLIQTFIFDMNSPSAQDFIYKGIKNLEQRRKNESQSNPNARPVVVRFIFDQIGTHPDLNLFKLMTKLRFGGLGEGKYNINFPYDIDPRYVRFEIKAHRHSAIRSVTHSKSLVVDRRYSVVTGANLVGYHHTDELNPGDNELMMDHGFTLYGDIALSLADEFYELWYKNDNPEDREIKEHKKKGITGYYDGNTKNKEDFNLIYQQNDSIRSEYKNFKLEHFNNFHKSPVDPKMLQDRWRKSSAMIVLGRDSTYKSQDPNENENPQNDGFLSVMRHAKHHININSPNLNSYNFIGVTPDGEELTGEGILGALARGVDVNFISSRNYQDYNGPFQQAGSNADAVKFTLRKRLELVKKLGEENVGKFNLTWFVTRAGNVSGKQEDGIVEWWRIIINEKFWNHNHTKFLSADNQITIIGSANMVGQTWFNSRELNVIFDGHKASEKLCTDTFGADFIRGEAWLSKMGNGERCWKDSRCKSNKCSKLSKLNVKNRFCVAGDKQAADGKFCNSDNQCNSGFCNLDKRECRKKVSRYDSRKHNFTAKPNEYYERRVQINDVFNRKSYNIRCEPNEYVVGFEYRKGHDPSIEAMYCGGWDSLGKSTSEYARKLRYRVGNFKTNKTCKNGDYVGGVNYWNILDDGLQKMYCRKPVKSFDFSRNRYIEIDNFTRNKYSSSNYTVLCEPGWAVTGLRFKNSGNKRVYGITCSKYFD